MKKIVFVVLFACGIMQGQVGEVQSVPETEVIGVADRNVGLPKLEVEKDLHFLSFYNLEYPSLREVETVTFYASPEEREYLYEVFKDQLKSKESKTITLGENELLLKKTMGSIRVTVLGHDAWFYLSKKQVERLFGKA
jgi:hypothetical protein